MLLPFLKLGELEAGLDEAGRGTLIGRVYTAAVIWPVELVEPADLTLNDSKKIPRAKRKKLRDFIVENALSYSIGYASSELIDKLNIREATLHAMHNAVHKLDLSPESLLVDGNYFKPCRDKRGQAIKHTCIINGDSLYKPIAAASILAKVYHDEYIEDLCVKHPELLKYDLLNNMGYGTKKHLDAIKKYGITDFHRKSFGICKNYDVGGLQIKT